MFFSSSKIHEGQNNVEGITSKILVFQVHTLPQIHRFRPQNIKKFHCLLMLQSCLRANPLEMLLAKAIN